MYREWRQTGDIFLRFVEIIGGGWERKQWPRKNKRIVSSVQTTVVSESLWPHGLQHGRPPAPSSTPEAYSNSCLSSRWYHPTISSSVIPFSSRLQSFPASGSFQMSQFFSSGGQSIGASASASVLPMNIQNWFPLGWTGWISLQSKWLSRVLSNTTVQKPQFFGKTYFDRVSGKEGNAYTPSHGGL